MDILIRPGSARGTVTPPASKSFSHRLMMCAALSEGSCTIRGMELSADIRATMNCVQAMGRDIRFADGTITLAADPIADAPRTFDCLESGSTLRFFIPAALVRCGEARFTGSERLLQRGVSIYEDLFAEKGITVEKQPDCLAFRGRLQPGDYTIPGNISSQFVSGLLFALPLLGADSTLTVLPPIESRPYIDMTAAVMKDFGVTVSEPEPGLFRIPGGQRYKAHDTAPEADWSNAAPMIALDRLCGDVQIQGLDPDSIQGDRRCIEFFDRIDVYAKAFAAGNAGPADTCAIDLAQTPDLAPILFAYAAAKGCGMHFTGTARLKIKESDRASAMQQELAKFGITAEVLENAVIVHPGRLQPPAQTLDGHNDHRIVMALSVLACLTGARISDARAVAKSYPAFFEDLQKLGIRTEECR